MINPRELLIVVDENNNPIQSELRSIVHMQVLWHRTNGIWVINKDKQILVQKRSMLKDMHPGKWEAFFGGHLASGQDYLESAVREVKEELGIEAEQSDLIYYKTLKSDKPTHREFQGIFAFHCDKQASEFRFEQEEIDEIKWMDWDEVYQTLVRNKNKHWVLKPWDGEVVDWLKTL